MGNIRGWRRNLLERAESFSRVFVDWHAPKIETSAPVAGKVHIASICRPDWIPIDCVVAGDRSRFTASRRNRVDVRKLPVNNPVTVRRPVRLHAEGNASLCPCRELQSPNLGVSPSLEGIVVDTL